MIYSTHRCALRDVIKIVFRDARMIICAHSYYLYLLSPYQRVESRSVVNPSMHSANRLELSYSSVATRCPICSSCDSIARSFSTSVLRTLPLIYRRSRLKLPATTRKGSLPLSPRVCQRYPRIYPILLCFARVAVIYVASLADAVIVR